MLGIHPEEAYNELSSKFKAIAKEYGVDITSGACDEFLNDLYDKCYEDLWQNIEGDEDE